ncbi:hypothetical protein [Prosthecobacter sp.]|uniref:hypothetical protein n=1 Tax=Prosthecobacter sp. TaxID=1965333 RepID=UPI0037850A0B
MHGLKYQLLAFLILASVLLDGGQARAGPAPFQNLALPDGLLIFTLEENPGKGDWVVCTLNLEGDFGVRPLKGISHSGKIPAQEAGRIIEECGKVIDRVGRGIFQPAPLFVGGRIINPMFVHMTPQGELLQLIGPAKLPPPELTAFLRILWQKLLTRLSQPGLKPLNDPFAPAKR